MTTRRIRLRQWMCPVCGGAMRQPFTCYGTYTDGHAGTEALELRRSADLLEAELERVLGTAQALADAIEDYLLWQPGRKGHAAAHRRLVAALGAYRVAVNPTIEEA